MGSSRRDRSGVSLIEAVLATAVIGASFVAFFGLSGQSMASASDARAATVCAMLADAQMNTLLATDWRYGTTPIATSDWMNLNDVRPDPADSASSATDAGGELYQLYALEHPGSPTSTTDSPAPPSGMVSTKGLKPLNAGWNIVKDQYGAPIHFLSYDVLKNPMEEQLAIGAGNTNLWLRLRVRCVFRDARNLGWRGLTLQTFRFANPT